MKPNARIGAAIWAAWLVVGLMCAAWLSQRMTVSKRTAAIAQSARTSAIQRLEEENQELRRQRALPPGPEPIAPEVSGSPASLVSTEVMSPVAKISALNLLADLNDRSPALGVALRDFLGASPLGGPGGLNARYSLLSPGPDGRFRPEFAELLGLTTEEFSAVQGAMAAMQRRVSELVPASATSERNEDGSLFIHFRPAPEAHQLRRELRDVLAGILGPWRMETFERLRPGGIGDFFGSYGGGPERYLTLRRGVRSAAPTTVTYTLETRYPGNAGGGNMTATELSRITEELGPLARFVPDGF